MNADFTHVRAGEGLGMDMPLNVRVIAITAECERQACLTYGDKVTRTAYVELCYALNTIKELRQRLALFEDDDK